MVGKAVHFWLPDELEPDFTSWDPDSEPQRYASGIGHGLLELYQRLASRGHLNSIGPTPPSGARHVVMHLESALDWERLRLDDRRAAAFLRGAKRAGACTVIRGDVPLN